MKGKHFIEVISRNMHYSIELSRNITIISGDSGTGKSSLRRMLYEYLRLDGRVEFTIKCSAKFRVFNGSLITDEQLFTLKDTIVIVDEDATYLRSENFAKFVLKSSNYFVFMTRSPLSMLPYSFKSIYKLETRFEFGKYITENIELFINGNVSKINSIITEDSNSGRQMLKACYDIVLDSEINGNSTLVHRAYKNLNNGPLLLFADGAALGPYIHSLQELINTHNGKVVLWAPESFEYILLTSGIVYRNDVMNILRSPSDQIEPSIFSSWERFFTWLVMDITSKYPGHEYSKHVLKAWYLSKENIEKFKKAIPEEIRVLLP